MALFGFGRSRPEDGVRRQVEAWARAACDPGADAVVKVNEIVCPDPACPGYETCILVMLPGARTQAYKIAKPVAEVTQADVLGLFTAGLGQSDLA